MKRALPIVIVLFAAMSITASAASASVSCSHSGPPANQLTASPFEDPAIDLDFAAATVHRDKAALLVNSGPGSRCAPPAGTLANTDTVLFDQQGLSFATFSLAGGPLVGGTPEPDGSSEIEVQFFAEPDSLAYGIISGTRRADVWRFGSQGGQLGASLSAKRHSEFDALYSGTGEQLGNAEGRGGNDKLLGSGAGSIGPWPILLFLQGGEGNDLLRGGAAADVLYGDQGRDRINSVDGVRDQVDCGAGRDRATVDRIDHVRKCEKVHLVRKRSGPKR
jgi:hemolysin type calcium-binding protein